MPNSLNDLPTDARMVVYEFIKNQLEAIYDDISFVPNDVYVVWFCFILGNYKALISTTYNDGRYYEITYNASLGQTYIDTYVKVDNVTIDPHGFKPGRTIKKGK